MNKKKKSLKTDACDDLTFFDEKDVDLFIKMCKLCIKFRFSDPTLNLNKMRMLYAKIMELS